MESSSGVAVRIRMAGYPCMAMFLPMFSKTSEAADGGEAQLPKASRLAGDDVYLHIPYT